MKKLLVITTFAIAVSLAASFGTGRIELTTRPNFTTINKGINSGSKRRRINKGRNSRGMPGREPDGSRINVIGKNSTSSSRTITSG